ncbi:MAG TPA: thioredoxin [Halieaceae bacterium]|jgi:putative thioredoxin|uniref:thioredoxin n=1 Tax=Haliea sp. TaxID=1932666 RepID=UPI000C4AEF43|nr:thioredoxin [Haliea sp.]HBM83111.1 thioredoxin [Halieaceae bacterium]MAD62825.1 thioredoxin [Haliea sp.]MAY94367.1 thioredoxin [Haliea sp.]MBP69708.1 thioredoxin [Haliea sp.]HBQ42134.1 thioredoxin [Halieaceae bacterium]|tara:strand:+ start:23740 stop:24600 length:861 start_codon:yes stop_codon:yes gene_type:complete
MFVTESIVNIDESNAAALLIEESHRRPVVVDFWADWCGPCKSLMPVLEKLANEYAGAFLLAKVNADEQPMISQQFGVRSLPTVMVMQGGQPVDGFVGAQSEAQVRELLEKYLPKPWDGLLEEGQALMAAGDFSSALSPLRQAFEDSGQRHDITLAYAHALLECNRLDDAEAVLGTVRMADQDPAWEQLVAQLKLKREAAVTPEMAALEERLEAEPGNHDVRHQLAVQYTNAGYFREALEHLITILRQDLNHADGATKKALIDTIASLGKSDPLAAEYQRKLYSLLY